MSDAPLGSPAPDSETPAGVDADTNAGIDPAQVAPPAPSLVERPTPPVLTGSSTSDTALPTTAGTNVGVPEFSTLDAVLGAEPDLASITDQTTPVAGDGPISPYLVLGLRSGADIATARAAFIAATKRLTKFDPPPFRLDDLTWALHRIEHGETRPFELRIPADPALVGQGDAPGLFCRNPEGLARATERIGQQTRVRYLQRALQEIAQDVLSNADAMPSPPPVYSVS